MQDLSEQFPKKVVWLNFKPIYYCKLRQFFKNLSKPHCESYGPKFPETIFFLKKSSDFALRLDDILTSNKNLQNVKKFTNLYIKLSNPSFNTYFEEWL